MLSIITKIKKTDKAKSFDGNKGQLKLSYIVARKVTALFRKLFDSVY